MLYPAMLGLIGVISDVVTSSMIETVSKWCDADHTTG